MKGRRGSINPVGKSGGGGGIRWGEESHTVRYLMAKPFVIIRVGKGGERRRQSGNVTG